MGYNTEDGGSRFFPNAGKYVTKMHGNTTGQKIL
jgi:hypothetical protein